MYLFQIHIKKKNDNLMWYRHCSCKHVALDSLFLTVKFILTVDGKEGPGQIFFFRNVGISQHLWRSDFAAGS